MVAGTVVALLGPTGVGKTDLAIALARELDGEVVSVDSRLLYRGMDIGTAKPAPAQRADVPHHLIDVADPDETWSLGQFREAVHRVVDEVLERQRLPILAGGTGQYMVATLEGWDPPAHPPDPVLRQELAAFAEAHGAKALHDRLRERDPSAAARIDPRNVRRVIRALELAASGVSRDRNELRSPAFDAIRVGLRLPRPELYARLDRRIDRMLAEGLVEEVRGLLAQGYSTDLPSMSAIGYRQIAAHLRGESTLEEAVARIRQATRRFVRHQANWFREDDPRIRWFEPRPGYEADVMSWIRHRLGRSGSG
ncbi:MAG TPA: tRNA (adenosine(37)-N6)-dimethylallyltransferase MiaA [Anaerolineales bacterium]|nr:tRNA (adenosine(37)-N6)-dimethylallyltransferase MiaA [Anaerolineales bacterium]